MEKPETSLRFNLRFIDHIFTMQDSKTRYLFIYQEWLDFSISIDDAASK